MANNVIRIKDFFKVISKRVILPKTKAERILKGMLIIQKGVGFIGIAIDKLFFDEKNFDPAELLSGISALLIGSEIIANQFDSSVIDIMKIEMSGMLDDLKKANETDGTMS